MVTKKYSEPESRLTITTASSAKRRSDSTLQFDSPSLRVEVFDGEIDVYNYELLDVDSIPSDESLTIEEDEAYRIETDGLTVDGSLEINGELLKTGQGNITGSGDVDGTGTIYVIDDYFFDGE
jgi:hypothetical protein